MLSEADGEDHHNSSVRLLEIARHDSGSCGFHLTRSKWDPYPWVSGVDSGSAAHSAGLKTGDCVLEVNGEDIVGRRITEVAQLVRKEPQVNLLLWNVGIDHHCSPETICCGPMPTNLQRLTACMSSILTFLECPICLDTIAPPAYQCDNGHLICMRCRTKSERCPVCRIRLSRARSILADQVYNTITDAFDLKEASYETRTARIQEIFKLRTKNKGIPGIKVTQVQTNKLLAKLTSKSSSFDNLSTNKSAIATLSLDNEFNTNLKAKSLSSNEIFISPIRSRTSSINRLNRPNLETQSNCLDIGNRPASYHGSCDSLISNTVDVPMDSDLLSSPIEGDVSFYCPYDSKCSTLIKGNDITDHFQHLHAGPLVQYFKLPINLTIDSIFRQNSSCYLVNNDKNVFFLNTVADFKKGNSSTFHDIHMWMWCLGEKKISDNYHLSMQLCRGDRTAPMLSIQSAIYSLRDVTWNEIVQYKKGIFLSAETMAALCATSSDISIFIQITKHI